MRYFRDSYPLVFKDQLLKLLEYPSILETTVGKYDTLFYLKQLLKFSMLIQWLS